LRIWRRLGGVAQGGLTRLAQARQNRPGTGELDLTDIIQCKDLTGFRENLIDNRSIRASTTKEVWRE